jgi:hypothetical protein
VQRCSCTSTLGRNKLDLLSWLGRDEAAGRQGSIHHCMVACASQAVVGNWILAANSSPSKADTGNPFTVVPVEAGL